MRYLIIDSEILQTIISVVGKSPNCEKNDLIFKNKVSENMSGKFYPVKVQQL